MKRVLSFSLLWLVAMLAGVARADDANEQGFEPIFDGKSLEGWDGNPDFWSVEEGAITGTTTKEKPTPGNTFIIWRKGELEDFELRLQFKIVGGNSGVQYRSKEIPNNKWVIGGYQADFDGDNGWTGTLYEERGRGILAKRGQKVTVGENGKPEVTGETSPEKDIVAAVKKGDWNDYTIVARGNHLVQTVNGKVTVDLTDNDEKNRAAKGLLALQLHAGPPMKVQFKNIRLKKLSGEAGKSAANAKSGNKKKVLFLAGGPSHGFGSHDHLSGCTLLARLLEKEMGYETKVIYKDWPKDLAAYDGVDCVVMYSDGGGGHPVNGILDTMDQVAKRGTGIVCIHYAVEVPKGASGDKFLDWIGGYFEMHYSVNPHWTASYDKLPEHPITRGVQPFKSDDEWYYHMRFRPKMEGVTPILTALPPKETLNRGDGPHSGNPDVRRDVLERMEPQHMAWAAERENNGRGFGFTGGHNHWNWGDDNFRRVVLNAIVWCAHGDVPEVGVGGKPVTFEQLLENHDEQKPANLDAKGIINKFHLKSSGEGTSSAGGGAASAPKSNVKPVASSKLITPGTQGLAESIEADIKGQKQLYLVVTDGGDGFGCDWADWAEPRLVGPSGEKKLTDLKPKSAQSGFGQVNLNKNCAGDALKINGKDVEYGIGTHAVSVVSFDLPEGYEKFKARCGLDDAGARQGCGSTVQFLVYTQNPGDIVASAAAAPGANAASHDAENAVAGLDVAEGLEATLFAAEPDISNITSIDIDHLGRVWACEVKNYRKFANSRPEGDRILVLEDTNGDGKCDKTTVFYQGRDIDSAHGVCVLGNRVIVSAGDKVQVFYDDNGDLKYDRKEVMFSGIAGTQHDHGIHAFQFGPDGKLYFNFGNSGGQLKDKDGKPITDQAGNVINSSRKPYQEGMVFRCDLDGSNVETLGWNFRNNWEVTTDSFGTIWQSDNDDDGNKGVRINYVMEFGNYGYKDEFTGAAWNQQRTNMEKEIPQRHWHLNDPGVVPTLLLTGAGSPTGICVYEGTLLPKVFQGQVIHCDAGPNVCRAYPVTKDGAGYKAETVNVLHGARDNWFRPSDVCVAPDGSLFVADWYDPGVGGHNQQEVDKGRIFRVAPPGVKYSVPKYEFQTAEGAVEALKSPNLATRYLAFTALLEAPREKAELMHKSFDAAKGDPRYQARLVGAAAAWLAKNGQKDMLANMLGQIAQQENADLRVFAVRLAELHGLDIAKFVKPLVDDKAPEVRRQCAIALRGCKSDDAPALWAELANGYDGKDRWYLEALGIGADKNWDEYLAAYLKKVGDKWNSPAGRDIIWRSRAKKTPELLAKIIKDPATTEADQPRYFRAFDFLTGPEKDAALKGLLDL
jgi:putative membrane-bound dehydrogenase-like protein